MAIQPTLASRPVVRPARPLAARAVAPAQPPATPTPVAPSVKSRVLADGLGALHSLMRRSPKLNEFIGHLSGPFVKQRFNAPDKPGEAGPAPLKAETIESARQIMASRFKPQAGKVIVGIAGGGKETVHAFVVSDVKPDGKVMITQALAQYGDKPEDYSGLGGWISKKIDQKLGNKPLQMMGVVEEDWSSYAVRAHRNSVVLMEIDADPAKIQQALGELKGLVGKPYDKTMLAADPATKATTSEMYCTEVASWYVNRLMPGTVHNSENSGVKVYQVADLMRASDVHGGPLKVLYNGQNRLDIKNVSPFPQDR